jgi:multidrug efflux pump subunit AcrA (membrane-fusion protein)
MMRQRWMVLLAVFLLLLVGCGRRVVREQRDEAAEAAAVAEEAGTLSPEPVRAGVTILAEGVVQAVQPVLPLAFEAGGRLLELHVEVGDTVQAGDPIATLDDRALQEAVTSASLQVAQSENSLVQAQLALDDLLAWESDETAVALAEANLAAAQSALESAQASDAVAGNSLTSARIAVEQAERQLDEAQEYYDNVFDPARDWEQYVKERVCYRGEGGMIPCTGPYYDERIKAEREEAPRVLQAAEESLEAARAQYNLARAGVDNDTAVAATASVVSAEQALEQATTGPKESEIDAARLSVEQAEITLEQSRLSLQQAQDGLAQAELVAPGSGTVLSVEIAVGAMLGAGTPVVTLLDTERLEFHTTNLSERDLAQIAPGQEAEVTLKAYPNDPLEAEVVLIGVQAGAPVGDAATFPVVLVLNETDLDLRPGMTGRVEIRN